MNVSVGDKYTITHADSPVFTSFDYIPLAKDDIIEVIEVDDEDKFNKRYVIRIVGKEDTYEVTPSFFLLVEEIEGGQQGGKRRKHRKTRHRKMKRSKTTKRKVRR